MATFSTIIKISALDNTKAAFSGAIGNLQHFQHQLNKVATQTQLLGFRMTAAVSYPAQRFTRGLLEVGKEFSNAENELKAVLQGGIQDDFGEMISKVEKLSSLDPGKPFSEIAKDLENSEIIAANLRKSFGFEGGLDMFTEAAMDRLKDEAKQWAEVSPFDTTEVTQGQKFLSMAGLNYEQVEGATQASVTGGTALGMDLATTADKLSNAALSFGLMDSSSSLETTRAAMTRIADVAAYTASRSNVSGEQIFESMKSLGPLAVATGNDFEYMASMVAALGNKGIQGAEAGVALRSTIARMLAPTKKVNAEFKNLGINMDEFVSRSGALTSGDLMETLIGSGMMTGSELNPLKDRFDSILDDVNLSTSDKMAAISETIKSGLNMSEADMDALIDPLSAFASSNIEGFDFKALLKALDVAGLDAGQAGTVFGKRHYSKMLALMHSINFTETFEQMINSGSAGQAGRMAAVRMEGLYGSLERLRATWSNFRNDLLDGDVGKFVGGVVNRLRELVKWMDGLNASTKATVLSIGAVTALAGPALIYLGFLGQGLSALTATALAAGAALRSVGTQVLRLSAKLAMTTVGAPIAKIAALTKALLNLRLVASIGAVGGILASGVAVTGLVLTTGALWAMRDAFEGLGEELSLFKRNAALAGQYGLKYLLAVISGDGEQARRSLIILKRSMSEVLKVSIVLGEALRKAAMEGAFGLRNFDRVSKAFGQIADFAGRAKRMLVAFWNGLTGDNVDPAIDGLKLLGNAFMWVQDRISDALEWLGNFLDKIGMSEDAAHRVGKALSGIKIPDWGKALLGGLVVGGIAGRVATTLLKIFLGPAIKAGRLAFKAFMLPFATTRAISNVGGKISSKFGSGLLGKMAGKMPRIARTVLRIFGKVLLRFIPYVGWALIAADIANLFGFNVYEYLGKKMRGIGQWFADNWQQVLLRAIPIIGWGYIASDIASLFGVNLQEYLGKKMEDIGQWFSTKWQAVLQFDKDAAQWVHDFADRLSAMLMEKLGEALDFGSTIADAITAGLDAAWGTVTEKAASLGRAIKDALGISKIQSWFGESGGDGEGESATIDPASFRALPKPMSEQGFSAGRPQEEVIASAFGRALSSEELRTKLDGKADVRVRIDAAPGLNVRGTSTTNSGDVSAVVDLGGSSLVA